MAGAGYKLFNTGDVLTAAQVNTYLMQQTVMVFASSAARTSALSGVLAEGMVSYLQDTNTLEVYDGSAWVGATGDITGLTAGTGISISSATGPVPTITSDVATTFDAKGDLVVGTGADTFAKLTVGANGESIVADSSASTGLRYQEPKAGNPVINSAFQVWQRGTSVSVAAATAAYTADRWLLSTGASAAHTVSRQATGDTTNLPNIQYCARIQRNSGQTGANQQGLYNMFETINSIPFTGKTVTVSFYARKGADFSPTSSNIVFALYTGTGTDQNLATAGYTGQAAPGSVTASLTTTWTRYSFTANIPSNVTELSLFSYWTTVGTAGANDYFEITGVQLEVGSVATPFKTQGATLAGELAACQRYYYRFTPTGVTRIGVGYVSAATEATIQFKFPVTMRIAPTALEQSGTAGDYSVGNATVTTCSGVPGFSSANTECANVGFAVASGLTTNDAIMARPVNANGYLGWSAEL